MRGKSRCSNQRSAGKGRRRLGWLQVGLGSVLFFTGVATAEPADWLEGPLPPGQRLLTGQPDVSDSSLEWIYPITKQGKLNSPLVEVTPFVFNERFYLLENWQRQWEFPGSPENGMFAEDEVRIRDSEKDEIVSIPLVGHGLGMALVWEDRVYVFAGNWGTEKKWQIKSIEMTSSSDLTTWSPPTTVLTANADESYFNVSVCRAKDRFYLLVESNDPRWPAFTFKYFSSNDLVHWEPIPDAIYGREKYVGGPAFYSFGEWFYTLYLQSLGEGTYETRVTRSKDLVHWQDAPVERPFVSFDPTQPVHPLRPSEIREKNASDVEICEWQGKTHVYFTGGDQHLAGDLQLGLYDGPPQKLLEYFFAEPHIPKPSAAQAHYQENQLGAFIHYGPATYLEGEFLEVPEASVFNPTNLDTDQWVKTAKSFGAKHIVLTAKHHNGFCLWPTHTTDYSVKSSPWKGGQGDVVREFVDSARKHGLEPGIYLSCADYHYPCTSTPDSFGERKLRGDRNAYFPVFWEQVREILTQYGDLAVIWFDGAYDPFGWDILGADGQPLGPWQGDALAALIRSEQPQCCIFNGTRPDIRWSGSEQGLASYPLWNTVHHGEGPKLWIGPYISGWVLPEANVHTRKTWFWSPDSDNTIKSVEQMVEVYHTSIGRGANLLVNMTPDPSGRIPEVEVERMGAFGAAIEGLYSKPLAETDANDRWREGNSLELSWEKAVAIDRVVLEEDFTQGQRIKRYAIENLVEGKWTTIAEGESVGRKRVQLFDPVQTNHIRLRVTETEPLPKVRQFAAFAAPVTGN